MVSGGGEVAQSFSLIRGVLICEQVLCLQFEFNLQKQKNANVFVNLRNQKILYIM